MIDRTMHCNPAIVDAHPTVLFLNGKGCEIARLLGFFNQRQLLAKVTAVADAYPDSQQARDAESDRRAGAALGQYSCSAGASEPAITYLQEALKSLPASDSRTREAVELDLADAQLAVGRPKPAAAAFSSLADNGGAPSGARTAPRTSADGTRRRSRRSSACGHEHPNLTPALESS